ncbi:xylulokinase [Lachnospiraceae bacterium]|jgi:xylulokinase|nr:xylulokinase [uncultured Schaedlerella sp.]EOS38544.1 xylulokinase [Lachnospiraceae bacterium M18-1]MCI9152257.1 xylulokinase [Ruminococcus sp.]NBI57976.1 xylulokinase [Lachnospiraceae bacterium]
MKPYLLGIDIGTSACKAAIFDRSGEVIASASEEYPVDYPHPGWAEQDPQDWWRAVCTAIRRMAADGVDLSEIAGIGIDGQSWSAIPVDQAGNVLAKTPIWMDTRAQDICDEYNERVGADQIFQTAGNSLQPSYTTAKILWYRRNLPEVYRRTYKILQSNSYIAFRLTGNMTQDISQGYGLHCFNMRTGTWDEKLCEALEIPGSLLPDIFPSHAVIGTVSSQAAKESGLTAGTPVAAGGLDAACGTLGAGVVHPGETQEQGGQAGGMSICIDTYQADPRLILGYHVVPGRWLLQGGTTGGGGVMRWLEREFGAYEREAGLSRQKSSLELFNEAAEAVSPGCDGMIFLPYMSGERSPIWDPDAKGVYYGMDFGKTKGHFIRAAMEGVAYSLHHNLEIAREAGAEAEVLRAMGGSANSLLWTQIKSDITGKPIVVPSSDTATTLGAAILAGVGVGMYGSFEEAVELTVKEKRRHEPNPEHRETYERNYQIYLELYEQLKGMMKKYSKR